MHSRNDWPTREVLRALCRLIVLQYPVPRFTSGDLQEVDDLAALLEVRRRCEEHPAEWDEGLVTANVEALESRLEEWRQTSRGSILLYHSEAYPPLLREIARPPVALFVEGDPNILQRSAVAIVGSRAGSAAARQWARATAGDLVRSGLVVMSGLARGIDAAAHEGALRANGMTVAVLGNGPDVSYPREHASLQMRIVSSGCTVSELPPGTQPRAWHFPCRNRILAGLVRGVVVVQAEARSGALITAKHALQENREIMAVPGDVQDPRSSGPHRLLRQGATLVEGAADVLDTLSWYRSRPVTGPPAADGPPAEHLALLAQLDQPMGMEELRRRLAWSAEQLQVLVAELDLAGLIHLDPQGRVHRT